MARRAIAENGNGNEKRARGALASLIERGRSAEAADIAWRLMYFWLIRGHGAEGVWWYGQILNLPSLPPVAESSALVGAAAMWYTQGELERARTALTRALSLAQGVSDMDLVAQAESLLGFVEHAAGNLDAARDRLTSSIEGFKGTANSWGTGQALTGRAWVALETGDTGEAERLLEEATSVLRHAGPWFLSLVRYLRAVLAVRRGAPDQAIALMRESLIHIQELQDKLAFVYALVPLAAAAVMKNDDAWAARIVGARDAITERTGRTIVDKSGHDLRERTEREARARLGPDRWAQAYAAGRSAAIDALLKDIDRARP